MDKNAYCVIMAGGQGSRFWPISKKSKPKQFLDILGIGQTILQETFDRFNKIFPEDHIYIITSENYVDLVKEQIPTIKDENIFIEPYTKDTACCITYANFKPLYR